MLCSNISHCVFYCVEHGKKRIELIYSYSRDIIVYSFNFYT